MPLTRSLSWTLLAAAGFALAAATAPARQPAKDELPRRPAAYGKVLEFSRSTLPIPADQMKQAKDAFGAYARYVAELLSSPLTYKTSTEFNPDIRNPLPTPDGVIDEHITKRLLVPEPGGKFGADQADYIREFGAALDAALKKVITEGPPDKTYDTIVRINATRALAAAARSGATAHYPTVTELIKSDAVPLGVRYYALKAAENLLSAYDINVNTTRKRDHSARPKELVELIQAIQDVIVPPKTREVTNKPAAEGAAPPAPPPPPTPEQQAVAAFVRRQAVRALAQVRYASLNVPPAGPTVYPAHTLARVVYADPAISPPPNPAEIAEATLGLCNMSPPIRASNNYNPDAAADAVATGILAFGTARGADTTAKLYPWRSYAARLTAALRQWKAVWDPAFDPTRPTAQTGAPPAPVGEVADAAVALVLDQIERQGSTDPTARVNKEGFQVVLDKIRKNPRRSTTLFRDNPETTIGAPARKE